jgi:DNA-binding beta-propeller fold protein YncE
MGIAIAPSTGYLWVVDSGNNRVELFSSTGAYLGQFGSTGTGTDQFSLPSSIAFASNGYVWVTDGN